MNGISVPTESLIGIVMLLLGAAYVFRDKLRDLRLSGLTSQRTGKLVRPYDVLQLIERTACSRTREHLVAALNCLLERSDATDD